MKCIKLVSVLVVVLIVPQLLSAQQSPRAIVKGIVVDDSTRAPIPLANVFVSNSTIGAGTDVNGKFELKNIPLGTQQVVASVVGYEPGVMALLLRDSVARTVEFRLKARPIQMAAVEVEASEPEEWKQGLERFLKAFFGSTPNSQKCRILNSEVLDFSQETDPFVATAREPLEIENRALGYRFQCVLVHFSETPKSFQFAGLTSFKDLKPRNDEEARQWTANRKAAYYGSKRHFLSALVKRSTKQEGFEIYSNQQSWLERALVRPAGFEVNPDTLVSPGILPYETRLAFPQLLQVVYSPVYPPKISVIELGHPWAIIYPNGLTQDPLGVWTYGYWSTQRAAEMLPLDYEPES